MSMNSGGREVVALNTGSSTVSGMLMSTVSVNPGSGIFWAATSPEGGFSKVWEVKISKG